MMSDAALPLEPVHERRQKVRIVKSSVKSSLMVIIGASLGLWAAIFAVAAAIIA